MPRFDLAWHVNDFTHEIQPLRSLFSGTSLSVVELSWWPDNQRSHTCLLKFVIEGKEWHFLLARWFRIICRRGIKHVRSVQLMNTIISKFQQQSQTTNRATAGRFMNHQSSKGRMRRSRICSSNQGQRQRKRWIDDTGQVQQRARSPRRSHWPQGRWRCVRDGAVKNRRPVVSGRRFRHSLLVVTNKVRRRPGVGQGVHRLPHHPVSAYALGRVNRR